ncbi:MAG TPA: hypothetical protein VK453_27615 [Micromonosporaceae bacterium]|nr:hypothetical protein [Micromonosporaceae bacterium]
MAPTGGRLTGGGAADVDRAAATSRGVDRAVTGRTAGRGAVARPAEPIELWLFWAEWTVAGSGQPLSAAPLLAVRAL